MQNFRCLDSQTLLMTDLEYTAVSAPAEIRKHGDQVTGSAL